MMADCRHDGMISKQELENTFSSPADAWTVLPSDDSSHPVLFKIGSL